MKKRLSPKECTWVLLMFFATRLASAYNTDPQPTFTGFELCGTTYYLQESISQMQSNGAWSNYQKRVCSYGPDDSLIYENSAAWDVSLQKWGTAVYTVYFRDANSNIVSAYMVIGSPDTLQATIKCTYSYDTPKTKLSIVHSYSKNGTIWKEYSRTQYFYDSNNLLYQKIDLSINSSIFDTSSISNYGYHSDSVYSVTYNSFSNNVIASRTKTTYGTYTTEVEIDSSNHWNPKSRSISFSKNPQGFCDSVYSEEYKANQWDQTYRAGHTYSFISDTMIDTCIWQKDTGAGWFSTSKSIAKYYFNGSPTNIAGKQILSNNPNIKLFCGGDAINLASISEIKNVSVFSLRGQLLWESKVGLYTHGVTIPRSSSFFSAKQCLLLKIAFDEDAFVTVPFFIK